MAYGGSTVDMNVPADWGLAWANINARDADELYITVQGEDVLWDADIACPNTTAAPNCRVTLVTERSEANDYSLDNENGPDEYIYSQRSPR